MINRPDTRAQRMKRHSRVRSKISGTPERPRLSVFRSENNIYAQIIDDVAGSTLVSASTVEKGFEGNGGNVEAAKKIGALIAERALKKGIHEDLENTWAVVAEAIQTILRREAYPNPYETLKALTRTNKKMDEKTIHEFIQTLEVSDEVKQELMAITPWNYTGV